MIKSMKLRGTVKLEDDSRLTFHSVLADDSQFSVKVDQFDVQLNETFKPSRTTVEGFLFVTQEAQQGDLCYLTMPKPCIVHGKQILVKKHQLSPRHVSLADFNPQKISPSQES